MRLGISARLWLMALALATTAAISWPAAADDRRECLDGSKEAAAATIAACTRAIRSGDYNGELAKLYHQRGYSWSWTGFPDHVDRAFKDYTEAIRVDPKAVGSLLNRSHIYNQRHDYDRAIADANRAKAICPTMESRSDTPSAATPIKPKVTTTVPSRTIPRVSG
jgi:tetratricopeptide (TPR) repeat protein